MSMLTVRHDKTNPSVSKENKKVTKPATESQLDKFKKDQLDSFEQGLTEVLLISRGEMKGTPLSELWDE